MPNTSPNKAVQLFLLRIGLRNSRSKAVRNSNRSLGPTQLNHARLSWPAVADTPAVAQDEDNDAQDEGDAAAGADEDINRRGGAV
eukprot:6188819-Pleurochrysis_carterae.AAC.4